MKQYKTLLFDLDGTLTESAPGIVNSVLYALRHLGVEEKDTDKLLEFVGPPLVDSFRSLYGFTEEQANRGVELYREYYNPKGIFENSPYEGIVPLLADLRDHGYRLVMATSKPEVMAVKVAEHFGFARYFDVIAGASLDQSRNNKIAVLDYALRIIDAPAGETVMIGDRKFDIEGAKHFGLDSIGVLYGYGTREELETAGADVIAGTVQDLRAMLLQ